MDVLWSSLTIAFIYVSITYQYHIPFHVSSSTLLFSSIVYAILGLETV